MGEVHGEVEVASHMRKLTHGMWVEKRRHVKDAPQGQKRIMGASRGRFSLCEVQVEGVSGQPEVSTRVIECESLQM